MIGQVIVAGTIGGLSAYYTARSHVKKINAKIEKYEEGLEEIQKGLNHYETSISKTTKYIDEIRPIFQGQAGASYIEKLNEYIGMIQIRMQSLDDLKQEYERRISSLNSQKRLSEKFVQDIDSLISSIGNVFKR